MKYDELIYKHGSGKGLEGFRTDSTGKYRSRKAGEKALEKGINDLSKIQDVLYAQDKYSVLIIFQAMDAAGKDGTIKHVMSGVNPQGCQVTSFKQPTETELNHDYLWRCSKELPERGKIGIFNRSYYEELLVTRVHPEALLNQKLPDFSMDMKNDEKFWKSRFEDINNFEKYLMHNGTVILKFFLHVSPQVQKERLLERIEDPSKNWKFNIQDLNERALWPNYMEAYNDMLKHTSTEEAPWYVIPADKKWFMRTAVNQIIIEKFRKLKVQYPKISKQKKTELLKAKEILLKEVIS